MDLSKQNAKYIQQLNQNSQVLGKNIESLGENVKVLADSHNSLGRDVAAMQRAVIEFLKEKKIINDDEDMKLLHKLHLRHIAKLDQEIAERKNNSLGNS